MEAPAPLSAATHIRRKLKLLCAFVLVLGLAASTMGIASWAQKLPFPPLSPALSNPPLSALSDGIVPVYRPIDGTRFGNPCRICPDEIRQGQIDDCFLISSLADIALVSPGAIQNVIQQEPDGSNLVTLHYGGVKQEFRVDNTFPALPPPPSWVSAITDRYFANGDAIKTALRSLVFSNEYRWVYAQPPSGGSTYAKLKGSNGSLWPMIIEKAYAATMRNGYGGYKGGISYRSMVAITGQPGGGWYVAPGAQDFLTSAWVHQSPVVPDTGDNSVLGGLARSVLQGRLPDFKAIQPNLAICAVAHGSQGGYCTAVCKESHECKKDFDEPGVPLNPTTKTVDVVVYDVDLRVPNNTKRTKLASFTVDPDKCPDPKQQAANAATSGSTPASATDDIPPGCSFTTPNGPVQITFATRHTAQRGTSIAANTFPVTDLSPALSQLSTVGELDQVFTELQNAKVAVTAGTTPSCGGRAAICEQDFSSGKLERDGLNNAGHDYFFRQYNPVSMTVLLGNPHGGDVSLPLDEFLQTFTQIAFNKVPSQPSVCGCN